MKTILSAFFLFLFVSLNAQIHNSVKIDLQDRSIVELAKLGLDVEHGVYLKNKHFIGVFSNEEISQIRQAGFDLEILIENLSDHVRSQNHDHHSHNDHHGTVQYRNPGPCGADANFNELEVPENFELGSFGGFFTYQEMLDNLDAMAAQYPNLITVRAPIDTILTHENRPIYWVKISDNVAVDEIEPEVLYTAVHHAREPGGMSGLIYFMWYILENYDTDPQVQALINETELYLIPCLNPDGYLYNEFNYFNGGDIYWRKNRRDNGDGTVGVDLNRNYGYEFAYNDSGSSPFPGTATYRGPAEFSEPETQAAQVFCNAHEFQIALNYHTYGNLLIYPWGYDDIGIADPAFSLIASTMVAENDFFAGTVIETLGYHTNGGASDWMFGENVTKPAILALTPELGIGGFYPHWSDIVEIAQSALQQNVAAGLLTQSYAVFEEQNDIYINSINTQDFEFKLANAGLGDGEFTVSLTALSTNVESVGAPKIFNLASHDITEDFISYDLVNDIQLGEEVEFVLAVDNGSYILSDTFTKYFGFPEVIFFESGHTLENWITDNWAGTGEDYVSANRSMTDSKFTDYMPNSENHLTLANPISLENVNGVFLNFWAKWAIQTSQSDYAQLSISTDGGATFQGQCGRYTVSGSQLEDDGKPVYSGFQEEWVQESIDLSDYIGEDILIRFSMVSGMSSEFDGFYFDDLELIGVNENVVSVKPIDLNAVQVKTYPNPAKKIVTMELSSIIPQSKLIFYTSQGAVLFEKEYTSESLMKISVEDWPTGMYFYELIDIKTAQNISGKVFVE